MKLTFLKAFGFSLVLVLSTLFQSCEEVDESNIKTTLSIDQLDQKLISFGTCLKMDIKGRVRISRNS